MATLELGSEEIAEQVVVAVPLAAIVERDDERIRAREGLERIGRVVRAEHRVAQGWRHPVEDRRAEQERLEIVRLAPQHLFEEVVGDLRLSAGQTGSARGGIVAVSRTRALPARPRPPTPPSARAEPRPPPPTAPDRRGQQRLASPRCRGRAARPRPRPDRRLRGGGRRRIPGSPRVTSTSWEPARHLLGEEREDRAAPLGRDEVYVVEHQHERVSLAEVGSQERKGDLDDPRRPS